MNTIHLIAVAALAACLIACGGASTTGGGTGTTSGGDSPFAGNWSGTFDNTIHTNGWGPLTLNVTKSGSFTGAGTNQAVHADFTATGNIADDGTMTGVMTSGAATADISGTVSIDAGHLKGLLNLSNASTFQQINIDLTK